MNSNKNKSKLYVIYQITNLINNHVYIGAHITYNANDKYMGSSKHLKKDIKELGRQNFKKETLYIFDNKEDMMNKETELVNREFCHRADTYNRRVGGADNFSMENMLCVKDKNGNKFAVYNDDPRYLSGELVFMWSGTSHSQESKDKIGKASAERTHSEESIKQMREVKLGIEKSPEHKEKLRQSMLGKNLGKTRSEEARKKMSDAAKKRYEKKDT